MVTGELWNLIKMPHQIYGIFPPKTVVPNNMMEGLLKEKYFK